MLKKSATKTIMDATQEWDSEARGNEAGGGGAGGAAANRHAERRRRRTPGHGPAKVIVANKSNNKVKSRNSVSGPSACRSHFEKKSRQEKSVRYFVQSQFQLKERVSHANDGNRHQWHSNNFI